MENNFIIKFQMGKYGSNSKGMSFMVQILNEKFILWIKFQKGNSFYDSNSEWEILVMVQIPNGKKVYFKFQLRKSFYGSNYKWKIPFTVEISNGKFLLRFKFQMGNLFYGSNSKYGKLYFYKSNSKWEIPVIATNPRKFKKENSCYGSKLQFLKFRMEFIDTTMYGNRS